MRRDKPVVLAVASAGGHWMQLRRLAPALADCAVSYVTTDVRYRGEVSESERLFAVRDASSWNKPALLLLAMQTAWVLLRVRPDVVISTGAAPGYFAIRFGRWLGARTIWVDSIANAERLSRAGEMIGGHVDLWLTQWPELARPDGPQWRGSIL